MINRTLSKKLTNCKTKKCGNITNQKKLFRLQNKCISILSKKGVGKNYDSCLDKIGFTKINKKFKSCYEQKCKKEQKRINNNIKSQWKLIMKINKKIQKY